MTKFCDNPMCDYHLDADNNEIQVGFMVVPVGTYLSKHVSRHEFEFSDKPSIWLCDCCEHAVDMATNYKP